MQREQGTQQLMPLVEKQLREGFRGLKFYPQLEGNFTNYYAGKRMRFAVVWLALGILLYIGMIFTDATMLSDRLDEMLLVRLGIVPMLGAACMYAIYRRRDAFTYDACVLLLAILGVLIPMVVMMYSDSPYRLAYQSGSAVTMMYFAILLRPRFRCIVAGLLTMCAIQLVTAHYSGAFDPATYFSIAGFYVPIITFAIVSTYFQERAERTSFLNRILTEDLHAQLERQSRIDALTGLDNRRSLGEYKDKLWASFRDPSMVYVFMIDIDRFKQFNDSYGHLEGDTCICTLARAVADVVGDAGKTFRFGGEELLVVLPGLDSYAAFDKAEAIRTAVRACAVPHPVVGPGEVVTVSIGVAGDVAPYADFGQLVQNADHALYQAKAAGRDRVWPSLRMGMEPAPDDASQVA